MRTGLDLRTNTLTYFTWSSPQFIPVVLISGLHDSYVFSKTRAAPAAVEKVYTSLAKHHEQERPFNITFTQIFPDDFWNEVCPIEPETPRDVIELNTDEPL